MRKLVSSRLAALSPPEVASAAAAAGGAALALRGWWEEVNDSPAWKDGAFFSLSAAYALVSAVALVRPPAGPCSNPTLTLSSSPPNRANHPPSGFGFAGDVAPRSEWNFGVR